MEARETSARHALVVMGRGGPDRLPPEARMMMEDVSNGLFFSAASIWEIAIKRSLGREDFQVEPRVLRRGLIGHGYQELVIASERRSILTTPLNSRLPLKPILALTASPHGSS